MLKDFFIIGYFSKPNHNILTKLESTVDEKHLTILPRFTMDFENVEAFSSIMCEILRNSKVKEYPVKTIRQEEFTSPIGQHAVQIVAKTREIEQLHRAAFDVAKSFLAVFEKPEFSEDGYTPHISHAEKNFSAEIAYIGLTSYQDVPFRTEILSLFDLAGESVHNDPISDAA